MGSKRHGLSIGIDRVDEYFFLTLKIVGKLRHEDYDTIVPMLESALQGIKEPHINAYIDMTEMEGWELRAAWDDLKLGIRHGSEFVKIAVVGDNKWQEYATRIGAWFISGEMKFFEKEKEALDWLR